MRNAGVVPRPAWRASFPSDRAALRGLRPSRLRSDARVRALLLGLGAYVIIAPFVAVAHEAALLAAARLLAAIDEHAVALLALVPVDPVYGGAALHIVGGIEGYGLAVAGPVGAALHRAAPTLFAAPGLVAEGAVASAVLEPGATVFARMLAELAATMVVLAIGIAMMRWRGGPPWLTFVGVIVQARVVVERIVEADVTVRELEATGLPFAVAALSPVGPGGQRELFTRYLDGVPEAALGVGWGLLIAMLAYATAVALVRGPGLLRDAGRYLRASRLSLSPWRPFARQRTPARRPRRRAVTMSPAASGGRRPVLQLGLRGALVLTLAAVLVATPVGAIANGETAVRPDLMSPADLADISPANVETGLLAADAIIDDATETAATATTTRAATAPVLPSLGDRAVAATETRVESTERVRADVASPASAGATAGPAVVAAAPTPTRPSRSVVTIEGSGYHFTYRVNGAPTVIRGMGYNPWYASLPTDERRRRYDRDFAAMRAIGVNTIEGWFEDQFDEVTLDAAHAHGLGVIMPFELNQDYDYADPAIRERFRAQITAWVRRYKDHPAVRMWGPGNENLHRLIFPTVVKGGQDPGMEARADSFAQFYVELIDLVRALDSDHPVVYRDAEDLYLGRIRDALLHDGTPRPWFVYGTNAYTPRLEEVIDRWPTQGLDAPLLVSEFSPGGVAPADRPRKLAEFWSMIRARPEMVLGGVVYTWATEGPEDLDRIFGLTDPYGKPVDGSLAALRRLFLIEGT